MRPCPLPLAPPCLAPHPTPSKTPQTHLEGSVPDHVYVAGQLPQLGGIVALKVHDGTNTCRGGQGAIARVGVVLCVAGEGEGRGGVVGSGEGGHGQGWGRGEGAERGVG